MTMASEELATNLRRKPFVPFRITLTQGSTYEIRHAELCMAGRRSAIIGLAPTEDPDLLFDRSITVDLLHIVKLEPLEPGARPKSDGAV
jgi:hypothetical protein